MATIRAKSGLGIALISWALKLSPELLLVSKTCLRCLPEFRRVLCLAVTLDACGRTIVGWPRADQPRAGLAVAAGGSPAWRKHGLLQRHRGLMRCATSAVWPGPAIAGRPRACGVPSEPSAAAINTQSVKAPHGRTTGHDAGKKIVRRKRHSAVDADGRLLMVNITPADICDGAGAQPILDGVGKRWPWVKHLFADGAYDRLKSMDKAAYLDFVVEIIRRS